MFGRSGNVTAQADDYAVADITGLVTALDALDTAIGGRVPTSRSVATSGLASGGGALSADRTINVPKGTGADIRTGTDDTKALTAKSLYDAAAIAPVTWAATITLNLGSEQNFSTTLAGATLFAKP